MLKVKESLHRVTGQSEHLFPTSDSTCQTTKYYCGTSGVLGALAHSPRPHVRCDIDAPLDDATEIAPEEPVSLMTPTINRFAIALIFVHTASGSARYRAASDQVARAFPAPPHGSGHGALPRRAHKHWNISVSATCSVFFLSSSPSFGRTFRYSVRLVQPEGAPPPGMLSHHTSHLHKGSIGQSITPSA